MAQLRSTVSSQSGSWTDPDNMVRILPNPGAAHDVSQQQYHQSFGHTVLVFLAFPDLALHGDYDVSDLSPCILQCVQEE